MLKEAHIQKNFNLYIYEPDSLNLRYIVCSRSAGEEKLHVPVLKVVKKK